MIPKYLFCRFFVFAVCLFGMQICLALAQQNSTNTTMATSTTTTTNNNSTQKDRRFAFGHEYEGLPPPARPSLSAERPPDFRPFPSSLGSSRGDHFDLKPTIKSVGHQLQDAQTTTLHPNFHNSIPKVQLDQQGYSVFARPSEVSNDQDYHHSDIGSSSESGLPFRPPFNNEGLSQELSHDLPLPKFPPPPGPHPPHKFPPQPPGPLPFSNFGTSPSGISIPPTASTPAVFIPASSSSSPIPPFRGSSPGPHHNELHHSGPHMPQIVGVDVQCSMTSMLVHLRFDGPFGGVVYSKGYFNDLQCHYVPFGSGQNSYEFIISVNRCGAQFVDFSPNGGQASLEDIIVVQNEQGIQEVWDTARRIQCTWAGIFERTVNSAFHVDMLETVAVTYSADTANAYMDIQLGKGPFAAPVTGLVKIGDTITVVIAVEAPGDVDVRVKECIAHNGDNRRKEGDRPPHHGGNKNVVYLTDNQGCVLKPKLLSPWHKTRDTGKTGANILAYSYLQAFKFPDRMEVYLECSLEICKRRCQESCSGDGSDQVNIDPRSGRRRRSEVLTRTGSAVEGSQGKEQFVLQRTLRVVTPEELSLLRNHTRQILVDGGGSYAADICLSITHFVVALVLVFLVLVASCVTTAVIALKKGFNRQLTSSVLNKTSYLESLATPKP